ncbi:MAG TPA: hypothetical protein VGK84_03845 [Candidatus Tumulicola sp.]|jgi:hypothetical protein
MSESFRTSPPQQQWNPQNGNGHQGANEPAGEDSADGAEVGRALVVGLLGGLLSAAGYMIYRRLPDEQKERINSQVRTAVQQRISELRSNFNI